MDRACLLAFPEVGWVGAALGLDAWQSGDDNDSLVIEIRRVSIYLKKANFSTSFEFYVCGKQSQRISFFDKHKSII